MSVQLVKQCVAPQLTPALLQRVYRSVHSEIHFPKKFEVNVIAVTDAAMQKLNNTYRKVNEVTDVLSFPYDASGNEANGNEAGEIVIDYQQARRQAQSKQQPLSHELSWLLIHGLLHIRGYDHETAKDAKIMRPLERTLLKQLWPKTYVQW